MCICAVCTGACVVGCVVFCCIVLYDTSYTLLHTMHHLNFYQHNTYCTLTEAYELWKKVARKYILQGTTCAVSISPKHKEMIASKLVPGRRLSATENVFSVVVNSKSLDRKVLEGLELAQCEVFLAIKVRSYTVAALCFSWPILHSSSSC